MSVSSLTPLLHTDSKAVYLRALCVAPLSFRFRGRAASRDPDATKLILMKLHLIKYEFGHMRQDNKLNTFGIT